MTPKIIHVFPSLKNRVDHYWSHSSIISFLSGTENLVGQVQRPNSTPDSADPGVFGGKSVLSSF